MKAVILAAGRGRRMQGMTESLPKCMLKIMGRTLLDYQVQAMKESGIDEIAVVTGYQKDKITHSLITKYFCNTHWETTNSFYSLMQADEYLKNSPCIISYSDIFYSPKCIQKLLQDSNEFSLTYDPHFLSLWQSRFANPIDDLESFEIDNNSFIVDIGKKISDIKKIQGQYMGLFKLSPSIWTKMLRIVNFLPKETLNRLDMTSSFQLCLKEKMVIKAISIEKEKWGEVDNPEDFALYNTKG